MRRLRLYRLRARLTQEELGRRCGFKSAQSRIALYESGERTPPLSAARSIVAVLNAADVACTLDEVFPPDTAFDRESTA